MVRKIIGLGEIFIAPEMDAQLRDMITQSQSHIGHVVGVGILLEVES